VPVPVRPDWVTGGAFTATEDPEYLLKSKAFMRRSTHEYGKATILTGVLKWSYVTGEKVEGGACIADIDRDGFIEAVFGSYDNYLYCLRHDGTLKWRFDVGGSITTSGWTIADVDGDGKLEILVSSDPTGTLYCLNPDGTLKWSYTTGGVLYGASPAVYDIDGDGLVEILFGSTDDYLYCLNADSTLKWRYNTGGDCMMSALLVDLDNDDRMEVMVGTEGGLRIICLEDDGTLKWYYFNGVGWVKKQGFSAGDIDLDGKVEVFLGCWNYKQYCFTSE